MDLNHTFTVPVPPAEAWAVLTDLALIAPCMPGAELTEVEGDEYRGHVKIKVGPITATYKGVARFLERDVDALKAVLRAEGRDARQGNANATITATLVPSGTGTEVTVVTDLLISGRIAQFGRGMLAEVSTKLIDQFVECLDANLLSGTPAVVDEPEALQPVNPVQPLQPVKPVQPVEAVDLLGTAGAPVAKRLVPVAIVLALVVLVILLMRRR